MKKIPVLIWMLVGMLIFPTAAEAADISQLKQITAVRWYDHSKDADAPAQLRLVVEGAGPVTYNSFVLTNPTRLVVDLDGAWVDSALPRKINVDAGLVGKVRISQNQAKKVRIVVNVKENMKADDYRIFTVKDDPVSGKPWRLVLDFGQLKSLSGGSGDTAQQQTPATSPALPAPTSMSPFPEPVPIKFYDEPGLKGKVIALDPGHGGSDSGAVGPGKTQEKNITLNIGMEVARLLEQSGAKVIMTRTTDRDVYGPNASAAQELQARVDIGNQAKANLFVSIHIDSFTSATAKGTTTYYYPKTTGDIRLARFIEDELVSQIGLQNRGEIPARFYVLKYADMPAALAEVAFISNPAEEKLLNDPGFIKKAALGIYNGIAKYFTPAE